MTNDKIVLLTHLYDQGDILKDYIEWHLDLGVDFVIAQDMGSSDNTHDILNFFSNKGKLQWFVMPEKSLLKYKPAEAVAKMAIDQHGADWIIMCDADEFLCPEGDNLRTILARAKKDDFTVLNVPRFNMTGMPLKSGKQATEALMLRIDRRVFGTSEQLTSGNLPAPYIFMFDGGPKTIVRAEAFVEYETGTHGATSAWGRNGELPDLRFLHYPIRGFDRLETKVRNTVTWFMNNPHLQSQPEWGWQWRRWIRLSQEGRLREDYENQFVSPARAAELIRDGTCTMDETVANWVKKKSPPLAQAE